MRNRSNSYGAIIQRNDYENMKSQGLTYIRIKIPKGMQLEIRELVKGYINSKGLAK